VVHGVGSGRLKRGLRCWLEGLAYVDKVCDANQDEGGPGCSVVWLR
jgi:DNA mismatch repair protein MutS2